eukprot:TRINITY_DN1638_c0_g1_i2.p1 TRINITY_DN1638_c0_g1~~TRINITY_DN1638_c0_g1_i2.p1  ORF type:complete len:323 (+),score=56.94 TRINITY_DN1638_c0_g1_i2:191-1159(+)
MKPERISHVPLDILENKKIEGHNITSHIKMKNSRISKYLEEDTNFFVSGNYVTLVNHLQERLYTEAVRVANSKNGKCNIGFIGEHVFEDEMFSRIVHSACNQRMSEFLRSDNKQRFLVVGDHVILKEKMKLLLDEKVFRMIKTNDGCEIQYISFTEMFGNNIKKWIKTFYDSTVSEYLNQDDRYIVKYGCVHMNDTEENVMESEYIPYIDTNQNNKAIQDDIESLIRNKNLDIEELNTLSLEDIPTDLLIILENNVSLALWRVQTELNRRQENGYYCVVCNDLADCLLIPCGHSLICHNCTIGLKQCPSCGDAVSQVIDNVR